MKHLKWVIIAAVVAFVAYLFNSSMTGGQYRVEACMIFNGQENCRTALGPTEKETPRNAVNLARFN